jgi:hypothetical protein
MLEDLLLDDDQQGRNFFMDHGRPFDFLLTTIQGIYIP